MSNPSLSTGSAVLTGLRVGWEKAETRLVCVLLVVSAITLWWFARFGVVAKEPLWLLVFVLTVGYILSWVAYLAYADSGSPGWLHGRIGVQVVVCTIVMYLTGWGAALALGYVFLARDNLTLAHGSHWRAMVLWVAAGLSAGQAAIITGIAPSFIHVPEEYGLAALTGMATLFVVGILGANAERLADAERALRRSDERLRTTLQTANAAYVELDGTGTITSWNSQAEVLFGWRRDEVIGRPGQEVILPEDQHDPETHKNHLASLAERGKDRLLGERFEFEAQHRDGHRFPVELSFWRTRDPEGVTFHGFAHDISDRKAAEAALRNSHQDFKMLFALHPHPMWVFDIETLRFMEVNEAAVTHYGYSREEFLSMSIEQISTTQYGERLREVLAKWDHGPRFSGPRSQRTKVGAIIDVDTTSHRLDFDGHQCVLVMAQDVSERRRLEKELRHQALHDSLTGLPNRKLLLDRAELLLAEAQTSGTPLTVLFIDLDNFKEINDSFGHLVGDELLQSVAIRLFSVVKEEDAVGRLGGDEFVVLMGGGALPDDPDAVTRYLLDVIRSTPFYLGGRNVTMTASIGVASGESIGAAELLRNADVALYQAKARGKNCAATFLPEMQSAVHQRLEMALDLQRALKEDQFELHYQPVVNLDDLTLHGVEALIRWHHPTLGWVMPDRFIPLAEEIGVIEEIGRWVLHHACRDAAKWRRHRPSMSVAVNVSAVQLANEQFIEEVAEELSASALDSEGLVLEITESILMEDANATVRRLQRLNEMGVRVAIDDFGTGFSSLSYLRQFPVDILKIDRSFVATVTTSVPSAALVRTIMTMAESLGLDVVAEGIETPDQLSVLNDVGCPFGQGFLFGRALPREDFEDLFIRSAVESVHWAIPGRTHGSLV